MIEVGDYIELKKIVAEKNNIPGSSWQVIRIIKNSDYSMEYIVKNEEMEIQIPHKFLKE